MTTHLSQNDSSNPIFSSYQYIDKNFNENMDEYVGKSAYEKMIEAEQKKQYTGININKNAINAIPVVPEMAMGEYEEINKMPDWYEKLEVFTPEEIEELKSKGKMGIAETWQKKKKWEMVPFSGTTAEATLMVRNANTLRKIKKGEEVSDVDKELLVDFLRDVKELEIRGGHTFGGGAADIMMQSLPYMLEFAAGIATTEGGVGFASLAKTLSTIGAKKAAKKAVQSAVKESLTKSVMTGTKKGISKEAIKSIYDTTYNQALKSAGEAMLNVGAKTTAKETLKAMPKVIGSTIKMSATRMPQAYVKNAADRQLSTGVHVTDAGAMAFDESEPLALSILKAFGETTFDNLTETAGWMFAPVTSYFAKPLRNILPKKFFSGFEKLVSSRYGIKAGEALKKYGYDNVLEEMGEELLNRFLCQTFGINGLDEYNFDGFMNNVLYANDPAMWGQEALSFALMGGAGHVVVGSGSKAAEVWQKRKNEEKAKEIADYANSSENQRFKMDSVRHEQLKKDFANYLTKHPLELKNNATVKDVDNALYKAQEAFIEESGISAEEFYLDQGFVKIKGSQSLAEQKLREKLRENGVDEGTADEFIKNSSELEIREALKGQIEIDEQDAQKKREKAVNFLADGMLQNNSQYSDEKAAKNNANLFVTALEKLSEITHKSIENLIQDEAPQLQYKDEIGYLEKDQEFYQVTDFDETIQKNIKEKFDLSIEELTEFVKADINNVLEENNINDDELNIKEIRLFGSYSTGKNNKKSDLDFLVEYDGSMREDDAFNMFASAKLKIADKNGKNVKIDINPTKAEKSGTIEEHIENSKGFNKNYHQENNPKIYYQRKQYDNPDQMKFNFDEIVEKQVEQQKLIFQPESKTEQSVQENIKQNYKKADIVQEKNDKANNDEIVDTGDSLLGNLKKNKKQYTWDELDNMNDLLRKKYLSKSYIYQLPSADELRKENLSDRTIAFIYFIHSKINARPAKNYDEKKEHQKIYFDGVHEIMQKTIDFARKNNELITNYSKNSARNKELFDAIFPDYDNKKPYNVFTAYPDLNRKALIVGGNKLVGALQLGYYTESDINKALSLVNKEKDNKTSTKSDLEGWEKKFSVAESYRGWVIADRKSGMIISNRDLPSKEIAEQIAKQMYDYIQKKNSSFTVDFKDLRNYIPRRENNQNVKPEALIEVFGFRGINFGNWTKQSERQDFLNLAYDSLHDLAELLNLPPKALSLDGKLGLAFGAQGRSNAAGHFIPEYNEINLTRKSGAGSLAHEWWHALDYYFGDLSLDKEFSGKSALGSDSQGKLRTEIFNALKNLEEQIKYTPLTEKELTEKADAIEKAARRNIEYYANEIKRSFAKSKNADKIAALIDNIVKNAATIDTKNDKELQEKYYNLLDERRRTWENLGKLNNLEYQCRKLQQVKELAAASKKYSKYYENAKLLNTYEKGMGSGYWTRNTELGARAFASYILDKTAKQNYTNNFLVRDEKGEISFNLEVIAKKLQAKQKGEEYTGEEKSIIEWYPAEPEERKRIFDAFDNLFNTIQYKQTDRGYKLYQPDNVNNSKDDIGKEKAFNTLVKKKDFKINYDSAEKSKYAGDEGKSKSRYWEIDSNDYRQHENNFGNLYINLRYSNHKYPAHNENEYKEFNYNGVNGFIRINFDSDEIDVVVPKQTNTNFIKVKPYIESIVNEWLDDEKRIKAQTDLPIKVMGDALGLKGKDVKEKRRIINDYYKKHLQSFNNNFEPNKNAINILLPDTKERVYFSNTGLHNITHSKDFIYANYLPYLKDIIETGILTNTDDENIKIIRNKIYFRGKERNVEVTIKRNSKKEWYFDIKDIGSNIEEETDEISSQVNGSLYNRTDTNNTIPHSEENLNPNVKNNEGFNQDDNLEESLFYDNEKIYKELHKIKGSYVPAENLIELFKNADESTVVHEFAHWWLDRLVKYSADNEELALDVAEIRKFVKNDGGEFTREQHEKFARGFEAYIRSGYARSNRLKRIFEDFKNALLAIYDALTKIVYTENGIEKSFKDEDMPEIQNLFDRLLTTERERIKSTVFDKVQEVEDKINQIKENEAKELQELDEIYKEHISELNRQSDKKRSVQEYLDLADKMTSRETKEVKEYKKRYKNVTLDILHVATGYDKRYIANPKNWEKIETILEKTEDKITVSGGMRDEWMEFYADTGVSYDNDEVGGGYELARQAFDVLVNDSYNKTYDENYGFEDINKFCAKVDYLAAKVKTLKGDERSTAIEAMFSLFNEMPSMPDEVMQSLLKKVDEVAQDAEIDTRENYNSIVITSIPVIHQLQFYITQKLNDLKVYNPETRYRMRLSKSHRLYRYIKDVKSINSAKKQIRRINEYIIDDMRNNQRSLLHKEIQRQLKINSKLVKVGTISKGKFDWRTNTVFAELVELNKLKREEAEAQLGAILQIQDAAKGEDRDSFNENETAEFNKTNDFQQNLKNKFIQYRSMKLQDLDVEHTIQLLQDILELKQKGREAKSQEDFERKTLRWNTKNNLLDVLEVTKMSGAKFGANWIAGVGKGVSLNGGTLANWESLLNSIFNKDTAQKYSLLLDEANSDIYARKHMLNFYQRAAEIYGFRKPNTWDRFLDFDDMQPIIKLFQDYDNEKYTYVQRVFSINSPDGYAESLIEISKAQMITMYAWSLNEKLEQRLFTQFGLEQIREMFEDKLSNEDKELAWALIDTCEGMREDINEVFIRTTGLSLPKVENYFPSKAERVQSDIDLYHDNWVKSSSPSFIKERKVCNRIPMKPLSPLEILIPHINKTAKYVVMSEKVNFLNQVFKDTAIKTKMQEIWGSEDGSKIYQTLINKLAACTFTNYSKGTNLVAGALDTLSRNYITSSIGFSPKVAMGQLLSVVNYAENMPVGVWAKGFIETLKNPVENFKYMLENCEYLQTRLAGNSQNEVIAILTSEKDKFRTLRNFMTSNVKWGDIIAITLGGKPYVDYLMQQGMSKVDAFNLFVENTLRAQQAGTTSSISEWQSAQAKNCLTRMFFAFRNTDMQYERKFIDTLIQGKKGEIGKKEFIKKIFIYKILNPFMFTSFLQNMALVAFFRGIFAGDDPDDVIFGGLRSAMEAIALGGLNAYGFAGFIASTVVETIIAALDKEFKHFEKVVPVLSDFDYQIKKFVKGDLEFADYVDAIAQGSEYALGIPSTKVVNTIEGVGDVAQGNIGVGLSRMAGWGKYTSTKAWTGKAPKKKK